MYTDICQVFYQLKIKNTSLIPLFVNETFRIIEDLHQSGVTILLVEQNAKKALSVADRGYVLETGKIVLSASSQELLDNPEVKKAYLGGV